MSKDNKKKVLIVDDDANLVEIYSMVFKSEGFSVLVASSGKEGLKISLAETPDIILLDVLMPVMDGFEMLRELRKANEYGQNVPVIMLTNLSAGGKIDIIKKIAETGPVSYIVKSSFKPQDVVQKVKERLKS